MPCTECETLLVGAAYVKENHRYMTCCPECGSLCIYVPEGHGFGNVKLTPQEINVIKRIFGSSL